MIRHDRVSKLGGDRSKREDLSGRLGRFLSKDASSAATVTSDFTPRFHFVRLAIVPRDCFAGRRGASAAGKLISSGVVEGLNNKAKVTMRESYGFRTYRVCWNWPSRTHLASCPSLNAPTISSDEPSF
jgi:hypothetical protein